MYFVINLFYFEIFEAVPREKDELERKERERAKQERRREEYGIVAKGQRQEGKERTHPQKERLEKTGIMRQSNLLFPVSAVSSVTRRYFLGLVCRLYRFQPFFSAELAFNLLLCSLVLAE